MNFFVLGEHVDVNQQVMVAQMYVEVLKPDRITHSYPLVFIHGVAQTATNWLTVGQHTIRRFRTLVRCKRCLRFLQLLLEGSWDRELRSYRMASSGR